MKRKYAFIGTVVATCFMATMLHAQKEELLEIYNREVISYGGSAFIRNEQIMKPGDVRPLLLKFRDSAFEYEKYRKQSNLANVFMITGVALAVASFTNRKNIKETGYIYALGFVGTGLTGSILRGQGNRNLQRSVWLYNRDILLEIY